LNDAGPLPGVDSLSRDKDARDAIGRLVAALDATVVAELTLQRLIVSEHHPGSLPRKGVGEQGRRDSASSNVFHRSSGG
jgi:hypothetical protein